MTSKTTGQLLFKSAGRLALVSGAAVLSGCLGPTYGTGTSQGQMLFDDLNNMVTLGTVGDSEPIAYTDRPELKRPENTSVLPPPQQAAARPETRAEARRRLQSAAYQGDGAVPAGQMTGQNPYASEEYLEATRGDGYDFERIRNRDEAGVLSPAEMRSRSALVRQRIAETNGTNQNTRRYLSEPPLDYRRPSAAAPVGDPGLDEATKQRRLEGSNTIMSKIGNLLPF
ncbi:hypothetical protein DYI37_05830 [Fulvimarina endophytica]|uniref:DUF3035 domain-containing protein n=2 Tax=Fulvimarina endophytica TaxID=2293836 RepID=A0A371X8I3_9HYPH|nr:hypothetical protein DYI37_05830 [Fulvimarina endophytica]